MEFWESLTRVFVDPGQACICMFVLLGSFQDIYVRTDIWRSCPWEKIDAINQLLPIRTIECPQMRTFAFVWPLFSVYYNR